MEFEVGHSITKDVEDLFRTHPDICEDYFVRNADVTLINKWLSKHGFSNLHDLVDQKERSLSNESDEVDPLSPREKSNEVFFSKHMRSNSKKYLRHDFAKSKYRNMFRTYEPTSKSESTTTDARRGSLKEMRMFRSLPPNSSNLLSILIQSKVRLPRYPSKDIDKKRELRHINEREFFMEIVKDISNDLDLGSLSSKIVSNLSVLTDADKSSIFVVEGKNNNKPSLVSKIFDIHCGTHIFPSKNSDNSIRVPWGKGIIGYVAETGETVNLLDASKDDRYNDQVDQITGYKTVSLLCMPIRDSDDEIVAVAQVINKTNERGFTRDDEKMLAAYLAFCGIAIHNAQIFDAYSKEYDRNKALLEVVHDLFEEQTSLENIILKIMQRAQTLLKCERCSVLLRDMTSERAFNKVFDLACPPRNGHSAVRRRQQFSQTKLDGCLRNRSHSAPCCYLQRIDTIAMENLGPAHAIKRKCFLLFTCWRRLFLSADNLYEHFGPRSGTKDPLADLQYGNKIAELVLLTEDTINIADAYSDPRFDRETDNISGFHTKSILCKPIRNRSAQTIGVAQIVNRADGMSFDEHDDQLFEAFTLFCGLGINNAQLYEEVSLAAAKQAVALETLSYHAAVEQEEVLRIKSSKVPKPDEWRLNQLTFNDFSLGPDEMVMAGIRIFKDLGLMKSFRIDYDTLCRWLLTIKKNYRHIAYHNWRHAFNVCQVMYSTMQKCNTKQYLSKAECVALIVACLCHDLDHRGTNNAFQEMTSSPLAQLYGTKATLEHHHFNHAVMILNSEGHNIFANISSDEYSEVIQVLKQAILATDLSLHVQVRNKWFVMVDEGHIDWEEKELKEIFRSILMTTCDIGAITKPWDVSRKVADLIITEFFDQGDKERSELKIQPQAHMDREKQDQLPSLQLGWIDGICLPLYKSLVAFDPAFKPMLDGVLANKATWEFLDAERLTKQSSKESFV